MKIHKLGKKPKRTDPRTIAYAPKRLTTLPPAPASLDLTSQVASWPMMMNDSVGDCTAASAGHLEEFWTTLVGNPFVPTDQQVLSLYELVSGYDPVSGNNDNGADLLSVLNAWRKTGLAGKQISAYMELNLKNDDEIREAIWLFGGVYAGVQLPVTAQDQTTWSMPANINDPQAQPGSWGGHAIPLVAYGPAGVVCVTWGSLVPVTWDFVKYYFDEAYAVLSPDFFKSVNGAPVSPGGISLPDLQADLNAIDS